MLDLGSGGGIDVLLSARRVGPSGVVYGLDMTDEMLALAQRNAAEAGARNVEFRKGQIENIPLPESVDVVISNCVINLSTDKGAGAARDRARAQARRSVRRQQRRRRRPAVHRRAGRARRLGRAALPVRCRRRSTRRPQAAGLSDVVVMLTHEVADGMHGAIVHAVKTESRLRELPVIGARVSAGCC